MYLLNSLHIICFIFSSLSEKFLAYEFASDYNFDNMPLIFLMSSLLLFFLITDLNFSLT